jgi:peptidoglycan/LPS O-acetylase OafA/YrhL
MWSLAIEEQFYLGFPLLILWARNKRRLYAALIGIVALGIATRIAVDAFHLGFLARSMNSFVCFDTLALGALCALLDDRLPHGRRVASACIFAGIVLIGFAFYRGGVAPLIAGACLFVHGADHVDLFSAKIWLVPARAGQLSYGMYLLQATAIYLVSPWLPQLSLGVGFGLIVAVTYVAAELSYQIYEAPMNDWIRGRRSLVSKLT